MKPKCDPSTAENGVKSVGQRGRAGAGASIDVTAPDGALIHLQSHTRTHIHTHAHA